MALNLKIIIKLINPEYLLLTIPGTIASYFIITKEVNPTIQLLFVAISISFAMFGFNILNHICDVEIDKINKPLRPLPSNKISANQASILSLFFYITSILIAYNINSLFLKIIFTYIILGAIYSAPPLRLRRFLFSGNIFGGIFYAAIPFFSGWSVTTTPLPKILFIFYFILIFIIATSKDIEDIEGEKKFGIKTIANTIGAEKTMKIIKIGTYSILSAMVVISYFSIINKWYILPSVISGIIFWKISKSFTQTTEKIITQGKIVTKLTMFSVMTQLMFAITSILFK